MTLFSKPFPCRLRRARRRPEGIDAQDLHVDPLLVHLLQGTAALSGFINRAF
jgi:hypothetical protein